MNELNRYKNVKLPNWEYEIYEHFYFGIYKNKNSVKFGKKKKIVNNAKTNPLFVLPLNIFIII